MISEPTETERQIAVVQERRATSRLTRRASLGIALCAALYAFLRLWGLRAAVINDKFDEGVYLSLVQSVAAGTGRLYRDLMLCHPPGVVWAGAWLWPQVHGSLYALRLLYIAVCALGLIPMYAIARRVFGVQAALFTLFLLCASPGFANWLGRNIFLDPLLNVPLYAALWMLLCLPGKRAGVASGAGALLGLSYLIKETAVPAALSVCLALLVAARLDRDRPGEIGRWTWLWMGLGFAVTFGLVLAALARIPGYLYYTFSLNAYAVRRWDLRSYELTTGFYALPLPMTFGFLGTLLMALRPQSRAERFLGLFALVMTLLMVFVPKPFYWRYLTAAFPVFCMGVAVWWRRFLAKPRPAFARGLACTFLALFGLVHLASLVLYHTKESPNPPAYCTALQTLRDGPGPIFTLDPLWAPASGHPLIPIVQRLNRVTIDVPVTPAEYAAALAPCPTVVLDRENLRWLPPETVAAIRQQYRTVFRFQSPGDRQYVEILRR